MCRAPRRRILSVPGGGAGALYDTTFSQYFNGTKGSAKAQSLAAAKATLNGLTLNCAVYTILQNTTWAPENVTYGACVRGARRVSSLRS